MGWNVIALSRMPSAMAAAAMTPNRSMRPITTAPSARSRKVGPRTVPMGSPTAPARSHIPKNASTVATVQTIVCRRRTGTPSVAARSARSALPRTATPMLLSRSQAASAMNAMGIAIIAITSLPLKIVLPTWNLTENGGSRRLVWKSWPNAWARNRPAPIRTWERPIVATVRIRRGARKNRRMISVSTTIPSKTAATRPVVNATK